MGKMVMQWDESFSVGIPSFDNQHKQLFSIINRIFTAIKERNNNAGKQLLEGALNEMVEYAKVHFEAEEQAMRAHGYPEYEAHKNEHDHFMLTVMDFKHRFDRGETEMMAQLLASLVTWLDTHLYGTDKRYTPYLLARNVK